MKAGLFIVRVHSRQITDQNKIKKQCQNLVPRLEQRTPACVFGEISGPIFEWYPSEKQNPYYFRQKRDRDIKLKRLYLYERSALRELYNFFFSVSSITVTLEKKYRVHWIHQFKRKR